MKDRLSFKNPFFEHGDGVIFTAFRNGFCVGRCTAQIDREHLARYKDDVGFFGFFDTIDDQEVAKLLLDAASELAARTRHEEDSRSVLALDQRRDGLPDRRLRYAADGDDAPSPAVPGRLDREVRLREAEGRVRLALHGRGDARARAQSARRARGAARGQDAPHRHAKPRQRGARGHEDLQRRLDRTTGVSSRTPKKSCPRWQPI